MKLLIATDRDFWKADIGSRKRICNLCRYLSRQELDLYLFLNLGGRGLSREEQLVLRDNFRFAGIKVCEAGPGSRLLAKTLQPLRQLFWREAARTGEPVLADFRDARLKACFDDYARVIGPDVVLVEYLRLAYLAEDLPEQVKTIIDTHDVMHLRYESFKKAGKQHWLKISREEELEVLGGFDVVLAIQRAEKHYLEKLLDARTQVIEAGLDLETVSLDEPQADVVTIGFIGTHDQQNVHGISFFIDEVWDGLRKHAGRELVLAIAGSVGDALPGVCSRPGIRLLGKVADLRGFYRQAAIVVNPVFIGGGLKIKAVEALAYGKPLVTTSAGARGLEDGAGRAYWLADSREQFIEKLSLLITSAEERAKLGLGASAYARKNFAPDAVYRELRAVLGL